VEQGEELETTGSALRTYLRAELEAIEVSPLSAYLPALARVRTRAPGRVMRLSVGVGGAAVVLVAALVVGIQLRTLREPAVAPPDPSAVPLGLSPNYGLLALTRDGFVVRRETDPSPIRRIEPTSHTYDRTIAISRSGRFVAYWRPGPPGEPYGDVLMVYDAVTNADPRSVLTLAYEVGGPLVWADDDSGIAFTSRLFRSPPQGQVARLSIVEMQGASAKGPARVITQALDGRNVLLPLAWIRETRSVSAIEGDETGVATSYVLTHENGSESRFAVSSGDQVVRINHVVANQQSRMLAYLVTFRCQDGSPGCTLIRFWALEDPHIAVGWQATPGSTFLAAQWRPFSRDLLVRTRDDSVGSDRIESWNSSGYGSTHSLAPLPRNASEFVVRPDGRSMFVATLNSGWQATLYDLTSSDTVSADLTTTGAGNPHYAVTLSGSEADRVHNLPLAAPLLSEADALALTAKVRGATDRIDAAKATLDRGDFPFGGKAPVWTVKATGEFESARDLLAMPSSRCEILRFNARSGQLVGVRLFPSASDCS
jgi:hypothetical protein